MKMITRRSVLAGIASTPLISGVGNPTLKSISHLISPGTRSLEVYLHGAFVLDIQPAGVRVLYPKVFADYANTVLAHEYRVGDGSNREGDPIAPGSPLALVGFSGAASTNGIDTTTFPVIKQEQLDTSSLYYTVIMPLPQLVTPVRVIKRDPTCGDIFSSGGPPGLQQLPLLLKLHYDIQQNESPSLVGTVWKDPGTVSLILHLRGEPGSSGYAKHDALSQISVILGTTIILANGYAKAYACPAIDEEKSLIELRQTSSVKCVDVAPCSKEIRHADDNRTHPANCVGIGNCPSCT